MTIDWLSLASIHLRKGNGGGDPRNGLCIMEMVDYFDGADRVTDRPACACPALTAYAISLNAYAANAVADAAADAANAAANAVANAAANAVANAAYAAANAVADAAADAANAAANAVAYAADAAVARLAIWRTQRDILTEAIKLGRHGGLDLERVPAREAQLVKLLERA